MDPLKMYFLLKMGIFHCYVSLPEGKPAKSDSFELLILAAIFQHPLVLMLSFHRADITILSGSMPHWPHGGKKSNTSNDENGGIFQDTDVVCGFLITPCYCWIETLKRSSSKSKALQNLEVANMAIRHTILFYSLVIRWVKGGWRTPPSNNYTVTCCITTEPLHHTQTKPNQSKPTTCSSGLNFMGIQGCPPNAAPPKK